MDKAQPASSGLKVRVLSALVLAPAAIALIYIGGLPFAGLVALAFGIAVHEWLHMARLAPKTPLVLVAGFLYLLLSSAAFLYLRFSFEEAGAWLAIVVLLVVTASDTGAYFTGRTIGGPKLAPRLSPKKTWAGLGGAMFWAGLALLAFSFLEKSLPFRTVLQDTGPVVVFLAGCGLGLAGQAGDLFISFFKRRSGLKDTGHLIPGHGGILYRIDSLLLVVPVFVSLLVLL